MSSVNSESPGRLLGQARRASHGGNSRAQVCAMTTVIVVSVVLVLGIGLVLSQLLRMKEWLKKSPPLPPPIDDVDDEN